MGPVLVKQETFEAKSTIESRLKYLNSEESRVSGEIKELEEKMTESRNIINGLLQQFQQMQNDIQSKNGQKNQPKNQKKGGK